MTTIGRLLLPLLAIATAVLGASFSPSPAPAQGIDCGQFTGFINERKGIVARINAMNDGGKKMDAKQACSVFGQLASNERLGRTMKWDEQIEEKIRALTAAQVNAAFRRHVDAASLPAK